MNEALLRAIITIVGGALAGGLTNTVAIWMLFHPYRPPTLRGRPLKLLQGVIPKNQARLATAIGRTVGGKLLTTEDITRVFARPEFRDAFDRRLDSFLHDVLETERGSVRELLGPEVMADVDRVVEEMLGHGLALVEEHLLSPGFEASVEARADELARYLARAPVGDILTPAREASAKATVEKWMQGVATSDGFRTTVEEYVRRGAERLLTPNVTIQDIMPPGLVATLERAVAGYVPLAIRRLRSVLDQPAARKRFELATKDVLRRFLQDLKFHQRVVARLVVNEDTVKKVLDTVQVEGADRISEMLRERPVREAMATGISDAIADLLNRPVNQVLGNPDDPDVLESLDTIVTWVVDLARDPATHAFVTDKLEAGLARASDRTWGQLLDGIPPERMAEWLVRAARSEIAGTIYREGSRRLATAALERPIGRPARLLPVGAARQIQLVASGPLWLWLQGQVPNVVEKLDVARRVETKVNEFPVEQMEEMVRRVTERELRTIIYFGYALGAFVGGILVAANYFLG
ncbi:MAG: DUF445 family protein [Gemmatimonadetes bacterium]|nr:DUF445 family protein [Gemmatimonadota bacterium]